MNELKKEIKNYGLIIPKIETREEGAEHVFGAERPIINPSGDYLAFMPDKEAQSISREDTYACTVFGTLNAIETAIYKATGIRVNYADKFLANIAKQKGILTPGVGADPHKIGELVRTVSACLREERCPWDRSKPGNFYNLTEQEIATLLLESQAWWKEWKFEHFWVFTGGTPQQKRTAIQGALRRGTVCVSVEAWVFNGTWYIKEPGAQDTHWTECLSALEDKPYKIFDSYDAFIKDLDPMYDFGIAKVYYLTKLDPQTPTPEQISIIQQIINKAQEIVNVITAWFSKKKLDDVQINDEIPPPVPPPPPSVPPLSREEAKQLVIKVCKEKGIVNPMLSDIYNVVRTESNFDNEAIHHNKDKAGNRISTDYFLCQYNSGKNKYGVPYWIGSGATFPSIEYLHTHPEKAVAVMCDMFKKGQGKLWSAYGNNSYLTHYVEVS
jgi:hypothetical protein